MDGLLSKIRSGRTSEVSLSSDQSTKSEKRSWLKVYLLIGVTGLLALTSGFLLKVGEFGYGALLFVIWMTVLTVQSLTLKYHRELLMASGVCTLGLILPFWGAPISYWITTALITYVILVLAHYKGKREGENMLKINFSRAARPVMSLILIVGVIMTTFLVSLGGETIFTKDNIGRMIDLTVTPVMKVYNVKGFSSNARLGDIFVNMAMDQIEKTEGSEKLKDAQKQLLANQSAKEISTLLGEKVNFTLQDNETVASNIEMLVSAKSGDFLDLESPWGIWILGAIIFLLVKSIEFILYMPLGLLAFMLFELLIAFGFITVQSELKSKEVINLL
ncbi:MAG: hypothetical protein NUV96_00080 [Candidatus Colwellbacteria bacterium]|nr:hypothetical protein [Candidatus Colwellbacteria bacterium]